MLKIALTIMMAGLMTHMGDDTLPGPDMKNGVILVEAQHHDPTIFIGGDQLIPAQSDPYEFELPDDSEVYFSAKGMLDGQAKASNQFQKYTPTLNEPRTNMLVHDDAKKMKKRNDVAAQVFYPAGELDIRFFQRDKGHFLRNGKTVEVECVPAVTQFTATPIPTGNVTMTIVRNGKVLETKTLRADSEVWVTNLPPKDPTLPDAVYERHFQEYRKLMIGKAGVLSEIAIVKRSAERCSAGPILPSRAAAAPGPFFPVHILIDDHPACTNTDYP
jgi:hypothetical protein